MYLGLLIARTVCFAVLCGVGVFGGNTFSAVVGGLGMALSVAELAVSRRRSETNRNRLR